MIIPFPRRLNGPNKHCIVVPVRDSWCIDQFFVWLTENPQFWASQIEMVHVIKPNWSDDIPYSGLQANRMIDEQEQISGVRQREFMVLAARLSRQYPELTVSVRVLEGKLESSQTIVDFADELRPSFILMFCRMEGPIRQFFGANRFSKQILRLARCPIHIVQPLTRNAQGCTHIAST